MGTINIAVAGAGVTLDFDLLICSWYSLTEYNTCLVALIWTMSNCMRTINIGVVGARMTLDFGPAQMNLH